jgi:murein biosynthesis integral membrane protein MurJ
MIAALLVGSLLLGFIRDLLIAHELGAGLEADILFMALLLPVFFENLLGIALRDAIIPHLQQLRVRSAEMLATAVRRLYTGSLLAGIAITTVVAAGAGTWLSWLAPGWLPGQVAAGIPAFTLGAALIAVQTLLYCQTAFLNVEGRFVLPMWRTVLFNIGGIGALLWFGNSAAAILVGMLLGQILLLPLLHWKARPLWGGLGSITLPRGHFVRGFLPVLAATALQQICVVAERLFASLMEAGSITQLSFAFRITTIPLTLYSLSVLAVLYPALARHCTEHDTTAAAALLRQGLGLTLVVLVPAAVMLAAVPGPIVSILLERGEFTATQTQATAPLLAAYATGLPAMGLSLLGGRTLLAQQGARALLATTLAAVIVTIALDALLYQELGATGLALALSAGAWVQTLLCGWIVHRRMAGGLSLWPLLRWLAAAVAVACSLAVLPLPAGPLGLVGYAFYVLVAHVAIVALLGERDLFTRAFWSLRQEPTTAAVG